MNHTITAKECADGVSWGSVSIVVFVSVCMCTRVCRGGCGAFMRMCAHMHEYMVVRVSAQCRQCLHVCVWTWVLHARMNFYMPVCVPVCIYLCVHARVHTCANRAHYFLHKVGGLGVSFSHICSFSLTSSQAAFLLPSTSAPPSWLQLPHSSQQDIFLSSSSMPSKLDAFA